MNLMRTLLLSFLIFFPVMVLASQEYIDGTTVEECAENHEKLARMHERAAECLRSGRPRDECEAIFRAGLREEADPAEAACGLWFRDTPTQIPDKKMKIPKP
jgi:hypothetical protein